MSHWRTVLGLSICSAFTQTALGSEYIRQESPHPESAENLQGPIDHAFLEVPLSDRFLLKDLRLRLDDKPAFWRDTKFGFDLRSFDFDRRDSATDRSEAWAVGGRLSYESGQWKNLSLRTALYASAELDAPSTSGDTGLLAPGQENIQAIGEANLHYRLPGRFLEGSEVRLYRQTFNLPYINKNDIRMLPATHEGYTLYRAGSSLDYIVGHLTKFKAFDSEDFVYMSEAAGAVASDKGLTMAGVRFPVSDEFTIGAISYYGWDTFNAFFTEATYHAPTRGELDLRLSAQFTDQRSIGDELTGSFDSQQFAARAALGWRGAVVKLAASSTSDEAGIRAPWGGPPSYLSIQRLDFDRANEKAVLLGLSYSTNFFSSLGFSSYINIARGRDAQDPVSGAPLPDRTEYNLTIDYKPPGGFLEGLWIRARYARLDIEGDGETVRDIRLILNYSLPFL